MIYKEFSPLLPPRAEVRVPSGLLGMYETRGWIAQHKKNGTYSVAYVSPDKEVTFLNRHLEPHKAWNPPPFAKEPYKALPGKGWYVVCAELLHSKVEGIRDVQFIHDILVADGEWLLGETYAQRYSRLLSLFLKNGDMEASHWVLDNNVWLARNLKSDFKAVFDSLTDPEDEGLVLKDPTAPLVPGGGKWSVKCRRPHANFTF